MKECGDGKKLFERTDGLELRDRSIVGKLSANARGANIVAKI